MTDLISTIELSVSLIETANKLSRSAISFADIQSKNDLLWQAALEGNEYVVNLIFENEVPNYAISGALWRAAKNGHIKIVKFLLGKNVSVYDFRDPLRNAVENGHENVVKLLLENVPRDGFIHVHLHLLLLEAKMKGFSNIYNLLLKYNTSNNVPIKDKIIECKDTVKSKTSNNVPIKDKIIECKDTVKSKTSNNANNHHTSEATEWSKKNANFRAVECYPVVKSENKVEVCNDRNAKLIQAATNDKLDEVQFLLENGANIHTENDKALWMAASKGHFRMVAFLLENGANIHACVYGNVEYPLMCAIGNGQYRIVKLLIENGANININRNLLLELAREKGYYDIQLLLE